VGQQIADEEVDARRAMVAPGLLDARGVRVDPRDVAGPAPQPASEEALAAADVERPVAARRRRVEQQRVVMDVVVPGSGRRRHWPGRVARRTDAPEPGQGVL
jgi:hypothetical protein